MIRVLVADDHEVVRAGLRHIIEGHSGMEILAEAENGDEALELLESNKVDVLLLDISMPGPGFLPLLERVTVLEDAPRVLVLSVFPEEQWAVRALQAGAAGYLTKAHSGSELAEAIQKIHRGGRYVTPTLAEQLAFGLAPDRERPPHEKLSAREFQVLCLLASGKIGKEIAADLDLSPRTVTTYRSRILEKLRIETTADLMRYAFEHDLVP